MVRSLINLSYFLSILFNILRFESVEFLTFETMFNESIDDIYNNQKKYFKLKEKFENKIIICFTIPDNIFLGKTVVEMQKYLFDCFSIKNPKLSLLAFETKCFEEYTEHIRNTRVIEFFNKIYTKIQNPNLKIEEISPYISFGIKYNGIEKIPNFSLTSDITKDCIFDHRIGKEYNDRIKCIDEDFKFTSAKQDFFLSFYSNFKLSKHDFKFCKKFYVKNIAKIIKKKNIGFLVLIAENNNLERYENIFNDLCNRTKVIKNRDLINLQFLQYFVTSKPNELPISNKPLPGFLSNILQTIYTKINQFLYHKNKKIEIITKIEKKNHICQYESLYLNFSIETLIEASEEAKNIIKDYLPQAIIKEIYHVKLNWLFGDQNIYFYKVSEDLKTINCQEIKKITVLAIAKHNFCDQIFDFFYYEKYDGTLLHEYKSKSVLKSQKRFKIFLNNLNHFLNTNTVDKIYYEFNVLNFLLVETDLHFFEKRNLKALSFYNIEIDFTDFIKYIYNLLKKKLYNVILYKSDFIHLNNSKEFFFLNYKCIYQNIRKKIINIKNKKDFLDNNFCYRIELKLKENEIFFLDIIPRINFRKNSLIFKNFVTKSKIKKIYNNFIVQNNEKLSNNLNKKLKYEDNYRIQFYYDRQKFYNIINNNTMVKLMNIIIDEIPVSELINIFEKSFLGDDKISGRYIYEFLSKSSDFLFDFVIKHLKTNIKDIKNEPLIYKEAYAFQDIFIFIFNQTRYEMVYNLLGAQKDFSILISWYQHYNSQQNSEKIFKILRDSDKYKIKLFKEYTPYAYLKFF
ncbi:hypothetical protein GVAV_002123 [Gurleya vavrai]